LIDSTPHTPAAANLAAAGSVLTLRRNSTRRKVQRWVERGIRFALLAASTVAVLVTIGILASLVFETARFFQLVSPQEFFLGLRWSPQIALRADQVGSSGAFGAIPLFAGALIVAPAIRSLGAEIGLDVASESALAAGLVMGIMITPIISSLSDDAISTTPKALRDASYALGATRSETIRHAILPAALPQLVAAFLLAISRAIGETMIVVMAAGLAANLTPNPLEAVTTVTVQIVTLLTGDQEFNSAKTLAAFALGLTLFVITLGLNVVALHVSRRSKLRHG